VPRSVYDPAYTGQIDQQINNVLELVNNLAPSILAKAFRASGTLNSGLRQTAWSKPC